ncbi:MAG: hypothetical protein AAF698_04875, partial [Pseudomonadota bacterium]
MLEGQGEESALEMWGLGISLGAHLNHSLKVGTAEASGDHGRPLDTHRFDSTGMAPHEGLEAWLGYHRATQPFAFAGECRGDGVYWAQTWSVDGIELCQAGHPPTHLIRRPLDKPGFVNVRLLRHGAVSGMIGDAPLRMTPNDVHIFDGGLPLRLASTSVSWIGARVPYDAIGYDPRRHPSHFSLTRSSAKGIVVEDALQALANRVETLTEETARPALRGFLGLLRATLRLAPREEGRQAGERLPARAVSPTARAQRESAALGAAQLRGRFDTDPHISDPIGQSGDANGLNAYLSANKLDAAMAVIVGGILEGSDSYEIAQRVCLGDAQRFM